MKLAITTGTYGFPQLIDRVLALLGTLSEKYTEIHIQYGQHEPESLKRFSSQGGVPVSVVKVSYYRSLSEFVQNADLVITHAGTGTVLSLLKEATPFIVVPNETLLHNHQKEYAESMRKKLHISSLDRVVQDAMKIQHSLHTLTVSSSLWGQHFLPHLK
ncbi:beta-1,4-N-acetylglucosaminyltransferase [Nematocida major]|uniref:beta-1,4-N-acetylglucosaminyltransferase n=1 Tax=Nematocida major TaxID=1912982 RepID=UPI002008DBB8|nr:beta-1,4-N-acetylglucosaminyltransferase [Nematocida major]KAH9385131.1 beta-1,4-N-acetylglucosaminyltransferase [Nematocida major]